MQIKVDDFIFKGTFKEELHSSFIQIKDKSHQSYNNYYDVLIQMSIEAKEKKYSLNEHFPLIKRSELDRYNFYIKLDYVQKMITQNEKFSLKDIIELYDNDEIARKA